MSSQRDPELDDVLQDDELRHIASLLSSARRAEPPLDDAFKTSLRRQVMNQAWGMSEGRDAWWRRVFAPPTFAWAGATAGLLLIASLVLYNALQPTGSLDQIVVHGNVDGDRSVALEQPILVEFNQPMDHTSTEAAVRITPATTVTFSWRSNTLAVQPTGGNLAPNTQYQVTIAAGAKTASGKKLSAPQTIRFVTQPPASPAPVPTPRPTPQNPLGEHRLVGLAGAATAGVLWSADSSSVYFVDGDGALKVVPAAGGNATVVAPDGVSSPALSPGGDRLAYIRGGRIEVVDFAAAKTDELAVTPAPVLLGWSGDTVIWAAADGFYTLGTDSTSRQVAPLPTTGSVTPVSIAPDGGHAVYQQDAKLFLLDLGTGKSVPLGQANASFAAWSPVGPELLYTTADAVVVADFTGQSETTLPAGEASWSNGDAILIGGDTNLFEARPDGSNQTRLSNGTYHAPRWAPNGASFVFVRGGALWLGAAPALPPAPSAVDDAAKVVDAFMKARLKGQADLATTYLDDGGRQAYGQGGLSLVITGDSTFSRYYVLTAEQTGTAPDTVRSVVRLVLSQSNVDVADLEETLTLTRSPTTKTFLVDQASAGSHRNLGRGPEVVSVDVEADTVTVTFDSDLNAATVQGGVKLIDAKGDQVNATVTYANRVVTLSGFNLKPGAQYELVVEPAVQDVLGQGVAAEYDLSMLGPAGKRHGTHKDGPDGALPSPAATPTPPA